MTRVRCPKCNERFDTKRAAGMRVTCPECERVFVLPEDEDEEETSSSPKRLRKARADHDGAMKQLRQVRKSIRTLALVMRVTSIIVFCSGVLVFAIFYLLPAWVVMAGAWKHDNFAAFAVAAVYVALGFLAAAKYAVIERGSHHIQELKSYRFAVTASVLAILDVLLFPIGVWALVVLMKPETKAAFDLERRFAS